MNIKKIGLSALAGSLAMFSANAVEVAVSGKTEITYSTKDLGSNGNPFGFGNALTFSGSGDVNGMTATYTAVIGDGGQANSNTSETFASSSLMLDMGDMGTVGFDAGVGEFGVGTIDDKTPYAYEEQWTYVGTSNGLAAAGGVNVIGYKNSYAGYNLSLEIDPGHTNNSASGTTGDGGNAIAADSGFNFALTSSMGVDGLNAGVGHGQERNSPTDANNSDLSSKGRETTFQTAFVTYAIGGATIGLQKSSSNSEVTDFAESEVEIAGISFAVNENLAVSYSMMNRNIGNAVPVAGVTTNASKEQTKALGASYTMGSAAVRVLLADGDNIGGAAGNDNEHMEVSLMLAF
jgi:outer membrane protein OmpU